MKVVRVLAVALLLLGWGESVAGSPKEVVSFKSLGEPAFPGNDPLSYT